MIPWPDPPLRGIRRGSQCRHDPASTADGADDANPGRVEREIVLRPWRQSDVTALVAAWADPEVQRWTGVPERRDPAAAERWIDGADERRRRWLSLDLVVDCGGEVVGEVGLSSFDSAAGTAEAGWWTAAPARGQGIATTATTLLVGWATTVLGLDEVVARCDPANPASRIVAERAGARVCS